MEVRVFLLVLLVLLALGSPVWLGLECAHPSFRPPRRVLLPRVVRRLRTGDLLLCRTANEDFRLSTAATGAHYSHVGVVVGADDAFIALGVREPLVLESCCRGHTPYPDLATGERREGWQTHPLSRRVHEYRRRGGWATVRRLRGGGPLRARLGELGRDARTGLFPSGLQMLRAAGLRSVCDRWPGCPWKPRRRLVTRALCCSVFVARWYRENGVLDLAPGLPLQWVYPQMFGRGSARRALDRRLPLRGGFSFDPPASLL